MLRIPDAGPLARWLRGFVFITLIAAVTGPTAATAQVAAYVVSTANEPYQPLPSNAAPIHVTGTTGGALVGAPFPIRFFGQTYNDFHITVIGYAVFGTNPDLTDTSPDGIPSATDPDGFIALWWDNSRCDAGDITKETRGIAPTRTFIIQVHCKDTTSPNPVYQAQLWLREGSSVIQVKYGTLGAGGTWDTTMGIENPAGNAGVAPFNCNPNCDDSHWPTNQVITYSQGADMVVARVAGPAVGYAGVNAHLSAEVANVGLPAATAVEVRFWISEDQTLQPGQDFDLGIASVAQNVAPFGSARFDHEAPLPAGLASGTYYVIAEVDPRNAVVEAGEANNFLASDPIRVEDPTVDLAVGPISLPAQAAPGVPFTFEWAAVNLGNKVVTGAPYAVVLSTNDIISPSETRLGHGTVSVASLSSLAVEQEVVLPADLAPAAYWIGIVLDPDHAIVEIEELNNIGVSDVPLVVQSDELTIQPTTLPAAEVGSPYCATLRAVGGDGIYEWSITAGTLPPGFRLEEVREGDEVVATQLCGDAAAAGSYPFTLRVESADLVAMADFELVVHLSEMPLAIGVFDLPNATVQQPYEELLLAVGGEPPYEWSVAAGELPASIGLDASGMLKGVPAVEGAFPFTVRVIDSVGASAEVDLELFVATPRKVTCMTDTLPTRHVGTPFEEVLRAAGGSGSYSFFTVESRRLATNLDPGEWYDDREPAGLTLARDGRVSGKPAMAGSYLWTTRVQDSNGEEDFCVVTFDVTYEQGISVITASLGAAYADAPYTAALAVAGGKPPYFWWAREDSNLPDGISLSEEGVLSGKLPLSLLAGQESKTFSFKVLVRDSENRLAMPPLSIKLLEKRAEEPEPKKEEPGGCQTGMGAPDLALLGAALGFMLLRRRG